MKSINSTVTLTDGTNSLRIHDSDTFMTEVSNNCSDTLRNKINEHIENNPDTSLEITSGQLVYLKYLHDNSHEHDEEEDYKFNEYGDKCIIEISNELGTSRMIFDWTYNNIYFSFFGEEWITIDLITHYGISKINTSDKRKMYMRMICTIYNKNKYIDKKKIEKLLSSACYYV